VLPTSSATRYFSFFVKAAAPDKSLSHPACVVANL
jgi:hypothetical protein